MSSRGIQVRYDQTGQTYSRTRRPDPRVAAVINEALRGAQTVANIGAGTGSYEPEHTVISVEPSRVMISRSRTTASTDSAVPIGADHTPT